MATDNEITVKLTADLTQLQAGMEAGAATVAQSTDAMKASVDGQKTDLALLYDALTGNTKSVEALAEQQAALSRIQAEGAQPAATLTEATSMLGKAAERLGIAEVAVADSTQAATVAIEENTAALAINGGVAREIGVLIGELARGNYTRLEGSTITLANRTGLLSGALAFLASPAGAATAAVAALGVAAYEAAEDEQRLEEAIINSGHAAGMNADQMRTMEQALRDTGATAGQAREAVVAVAASGTLLGANFQNAAQAAVDMAQLTGVSIDKAVTAIARLQEDPVKSIMKLNETMNFLSPTEAAEIKHLQDIGDKAGAASLAIADLAEAERKRSKEQNDEGDGANSWTGKLKAGASAMWAGAKNIFAPDTLKQQLDEVNKVLAEYAADSPGSITQDDKNQVHVDKEKIRGDLYEQVNRLLAQRAELQAKITAEEEKQEAVSAKVAADKAKVNATLAAPAPKKKAAASSHADHDQAQSDRDEFNTERLQHNLSLADEKRYWQAKKDAATEGTQAYRQAVQELVQIKDKEATAGRAVSRQEVADAKHAAHERIQAEKEVEREKERAAEKARQLSLEKLKDANSAADRDLANARERDELDYSEGKISAQRLLDLEKDLAAQKLAIDKKYFQDKEKLDAGDPIAVQKDEAAIVKAQQDAQTAMMRAEKEFHANSEQQWKSYAKKIEGAIQGAVNGMLFQHQTLRKELANVAMVIGENFIQSAIQQPLDKWIAAESAKLSATIATLTGQSEATTTQRTADASADAAASMASVTRASGVAGAQGVASFAGAPWPIDMGAPAFGAGMALAALSYGSVASAAGGWDRVPIDGAMTELHKDEMVLPKPLADGVRNMAQSGGGQGGGNSYHFHSFDSRGIFDHARRRPEDFAKAMKHVARRGHLR